MSILDRVLRKLVEAERKKNGRIAQTTMLIVDSKSNQNADIAEKKGYADVCHCEPIAKIVDGFITNLNIPEGILTMCRPARYTVPDY